MCQEALKHPALPFSPPDFTLSLLSKGLSLDVQDSGLGRDNTDKLAESTTSAMVKMILGIHCLTGLISRNKQMQWKNKAPELKICILIGAHVD